MTRCVRFPRRALWLVLALLLLVRVPVAGGFSGGAPAVTAPLVGGSGSVYLALGDSVAAGIGASRPGAGGYAALLADLLDRRAEASGQRLNLAVPGETTGSLVAGGQLSWALRWLAAAERNDVPVGPITVTIGANDLLRAGDDPAARSAAVRRVAANLRVLLVRLGAATAGPGGERTTPIVVTGYYDPTGTRRDQPGSDAWWLAQLDAVLAREARRAGAGWVDVAAAFAGREDELTGYPRDIHPTDAGHRVIADAIWQVLTAAPAPEESGDVMRADRPRP